MDNIYPCGKFCVMTHNSYATISMWLKAFVWLIDFHEWHAQFNQSMLIFKSFWLSSIYSKVVSFLITLLLLAWSSTYKWAASYYLDSALVLLAQMLAVTIKCASLIHSKGSTTLNFCWCDSGIFSWFQDSWMNSYDACMSKKGLYMHRQWEERARGLKLPSF